MLRLVQLPHDAVEKARGSGVLTLGSDEGAQVTLKVSSAETLRTLLQMSPQDGLEILGTFTVEIAL
jgi:hypothetical protein